MTHMFDTEIAELVGVNAAIIFGNLVFWIKKNEANEEHYHDGSYWTYNSKAAWKKLFPYMTDKQVRGSFQKLIDEGLIKTGCYNSKPFDRTLWYALTEKGNSMLPKRATPFALEGQPIPDINPDNKPDINNPPISPLEGKCDSEPDNNLDAQRFESFWQAYPRNKRKAKQDARKAWDNLKVDGELYTVIMQGLAIQCKSQDWARDDGKYIPYPATWLNGKRWEDEVEAAPQQPERPQPKKLTLRR